MHFEKSALCIVHESKSVFCNLEFLNLTFIRLNPCKVFSLSLQLENCEFIRLERKKLHSISVELEKTASLQFVSLTSVLFQMMLLLQRLSKSEFVMLASSRRPE